MKRVLCPKCDNYITFDETKYTEGQSLVFICEHCKKQFSIRIGKSKLKATRKEEVLDEQANNEDFGSIVVVENVFGYKQVLPLKEGDNLIGRRSKGTDVDISIETSDPSMDRRQVVHFMLVSKRYVHAVLIQQSHAEREAAAVALRMGIGGDTRLNSA